MNYKEKNTENITNRYEEKNQIHSDPVIQHELDT